MLKHPITLIIQHIRKTSFSNSEIFLITMSIEE